MTSNRQRLEPSPPGSAVDSRVETAGQVPLFDILPNFEEERQVTGQPSAVAQTILDGRSLPGEQFRLLGARLRALGRDKRLRRIGVVSATPGEGATTVSLGLARALALDRRHRVLLLELDLRRPALDQALGLTPPKIGLGEYLQGEGETPMLRRPIAGGFWLLSAGSHALEKPDILSSPRLAILLKAADRVFDYVIADCPPLMPAADAVVAQDLLDGFVFVVRSRHSPREMIQQAVSVLRAGAITGLVLNTHHDVLASYREYTYRRADQKA
jgi:Mrp family chromosome partitioning ATPase